MIIATLLGSTFICSLLYIWSQDKLLLELIAEGKESLEKAPVA